MTKPFIFVYTLPLHIPQQSIVSSLAPDLPSLPNLSTNISGKTPMNISFRKTLHSESTARSPIKWSKQCTRSCTCIYMVEDQKAIIDAAVTDAVLPGRQNSNGSLLFRHRMRSRGQRSRTGSEERPSQQNQSLLQPSDQCLFPTSWLME